jgi:hypothetical protein
LRSSLQLDGHRVSLRAFVSPFKVFDQNHVLPESL